MTTAPGESRVEKMLNFEFTSDPRRSRFPLPELPEGWPKDKPHPFPPMDVTPEMARDWVQHRFIVPEITPRELKHDEFRANRRIVFPKLFGNQYKPGLVDIVERGLWNPRISQGGAFTWDGYVSDAQHRFIAIALAGKTVPMILTLNSGWDAFDVTDDVRTRTAGQFLGENGELKSSIARHIYPILLGTETKEYTSRVPTITDLRELVEAWPWFHTTESLDNGPDKSLLSLVKQVNRESRIPKAPLGAVAVAALAAGADPFEVDAFLKGCLVSFNGSFEIIGTDGDDPRYLLRKKFNLGGAKAGRLDDSTQYSNAALIRYAMNIWLTRHEENPIKVRGQFDRWRLERKLPTFWNSDNVREFHAAQFN